MSDRRLLGPSPLPEGVEFRGLDFRDVVLRIFPLRSSMARLERLVDDYLNMDLDPEIAHFEPLAPYVFFMVLNYGQMGPVASNLGWVAQHEIVFSILVQGSWIEEGRRVREVASVSPFIFVDSDQSIISGREAWGWPKYPARLRPGLSSWLSDPRRPHRLLTLETPMFSELYAGRRLEYLPLLELEQESPQLIGQLPPDFAYLLDPLARLPKALADGVAAGTELLGQMLQGAFDAEAVPLAALLDQLGSQLGSLPTPAISTLNLKQFRTGDPLAPETAAYQALVNARMEFRRLQATGPLGDVELMRGDPTGGFAIYLHHNPGFPFVEALGLEVEETIDHGGIRVDRVEPLLPFWMAADLGYRPARRLCWRSRHCGWSTGADSAVEPRGAAPLFNTIRGPLVEAVQGPFDFYDASLRVLPLRARSERLELLVPERFRQGAVDGHEYSLQPYRAPGILHDDPFDAWVLMIVGSFDSMSSKANDLGAWAGTEVGFAVPFELSIRPESFDHVMYRLRRLYPFLDDFDSETYRGAVRLLLWPFVFAGSPLSVTEAREVRGVPTTYARIRRGRDRWSESNGPARDRHLLSAGVVDYPALGVGQQARTLRLLDLERLAGSTSVAAGDWQVGGLTGDRLRDLCPAGLRLPALSLKEFLDEEDMSSACYRAVVANELRIRKVPAPQGLRGRYRLTVHPLPSLPLVEALGLDATTQRDGGATVQVCEAQNPFWLTTDLTQQLPLTLWSQSVDGRWWTEQADRYFAEWLAPPAAGSPTTLGQVLDELASG